MRGEILPVGSSEHAFRRNLTCPQALLKYMRHIRQTDGRENGPN